MAKARLGPLMFGIVIAAVVAVAGQTFAVATPSPRTTVATARVATDVIPGSSDACLQAANTFPKNAAGVATVKPISPYTSAPPLIYPWFDTDDIKTRGITDLSDHTPWGFAQQFSRLLCYTAPNATINAAYYFFRATNGSDSAELKRPESDPETVYNALQWLAENRNVKVNIILDNTNTCDDVSGDATCTNIMAKVPRAAVEKRFAKIPGSKVKYCFNGCFNTARLGVWPYAIQHEKFFAVSNTEFPGVTSGTHPLVISSSANLARSQIRNYHQEASSIFDDNALYQHFNNRFLGMQSCLQDGCRMLGNPSVLNTSNPNVATAAANPLGLQQEDDRKIWVDPILRHTTDPERGTTVTFSPGRSADIHKFDVYVNQFDNVNCGIDNKIRLAMFKLTDGKAAAMAAKLKSLKKAGCDVKMLMTSEGGQTVISKSVQTTLKNAGVNFKCTVDAMHTKMILIGPSTGNLGRILVGTQNMSVAGQLYNEEHVITFDSRRASGAGRSAIRAAYDQYQHEWFELSRSASQKRCLAR